MSVGGDNWVGVTEKGSKPVIHTLPRPKQNLKEKEQRNADVHSLRGGSGYRWGVREFVVLSALRPWGSRRQ